jgi:two-component system, LytTR family, sensor kinase
MNLVKKYYLKTGVALAALFPGIFVFDKAGKDLIGASLLFFTIFFSIIILWIYNAIFVDFVALLRSNSYREFNPTYRNILISLSIALPLYFTLAIVFNQQHVLFSSLFESNFSTKALFYVIMRVIMFDAGLLLIKFLIDNNKEKQRFKIENEVLKNEQLKATHETLKQQVDPHFLFNSLSTLQSLVKQQNTEHALQFIRELSRVYRYMLIRRDKDLVTVKEEIEFLRSYLYLLEIRFGAGFNTIINVDEKCSSTNIPIHTLQLLAENAVKHNVVGKEEPLTLQIRSDDKHLIVSNNLLPKQHNVQSAGIGLENINTRYSLLFGKEISISTANGHFTVLLPVINGHENINHRG